MKISKRVKQLLSFYEGETPGVKANLARILMEGKLGGTGHLIILPVDQGFEHGPDRSFAANPPAYDPLYHYELAVEAGLSAYAAPLGALEAGADTFAGAIPTILKMNSGNSLSRNRQGADQAITASVKDAARLGCSAIGFTIYPGSDAMYSQYEEVRELRREAAEYGIATVIWSYPRGGDLTSEAEQSIDVISYGAHMAALLGAHIIKVKLPSANLGNAESRKAFEANKIPVKTLTERVAHVMQASFNGRRIVVFSGGAAKDEASVYDDAVAIRDGGGNGSIIGRNCFQRPRSEALAMLQKMIEIYKQQR